MNHCKRVKNMFYFFLWDNKKTVNMTCKKNKNYYTKKSEQLI